MNQFGCVRDQSTTCALLQFMYELFKASDNSSNVIRVSFIDFTEAFDLIDRNVLMKKFISNGIPDHITVWSLDFASRWTQFVMWVLLKVLLLDQIISSC